ncbi:hypothetical protein C4900_07765 [Acidiferrobacter thiooxydans]|uniref:Uncharacterized protein n=1 Tax=Acidiferrobacter thiooxydans TaxID=163359 RepID=A0A1C2FWU6_9GAMM|nr:hypothetical protein C4900_07765 [Acidiferrobacter thiooxydans]
MTKNLLHFVAVKVGGDTYDLRQADHLLLKVPVIYKKVPTSRWTDKHNRITPIGPFDVSAQASISVFIGPYALDCTTRSITGEFGIR